MNSSLKTTMMALALVCSVATTAQPRSAYAVGGILATAGTVGWAIPVAVAGGVVMGTGLYLGRDRGSSSGKFAAFALTAIGFILLEDNGSGNGSVAYTPVAQSDDSRLGISEPQRLAYNAELDEINAIRETIVAEIETELTKNPSLNIQAYAQSRWQAYRGAISSDAYETLKAVSGSFILYMQGA